MRIRKILVVDDSKLLHGMYDLVLMRYRSQGVAVIHAYDGREALEALETNPGVGLVLLDVNMPVMGGLEFLAHRRRDPLLARIPVIVISTRGREEETRQGLEAGASAYLTKPFQPHDLHRLVEQFGGAASDGRTESPGGSAGVESSPADLPEAAPARFHPCGATRPTPVG